MMQTTTPTSLQIRQIDIMLWTSIPYYAAELLLTNMTFEYPNYMVHHLFSFLVFFSFLSEKRVYSVCCKSNNSSNYAALLPFVCHAFYWLNPIFDFDVEILGIYNLSFIVCGLIGLYQRIVHGGTTNSIRIPILSVIIVAVNYYSYCTDYNGNCPRELYSLDELTVLKLVTLGITFCVVVPTLVAAFIAKAKKNAIEKIVDSDDTSSEDEAISLSKKKAI